jgi:hypothetical protein
MGKVDRAVPLLDAKKKCAFGAKITSPAERPIHLIARQGAMFM